MSLGQSLIEDGLAACVSLVPGAQSIYLWDGAIQTTPETLMWIKVKANGAEALRDALMARHPYSVPEVVVLDVDTSLSSPAYVAWVQGVGAG
jgi:periplasmic divalent cation tolerance protein